MRTRSANHPARHEACRLIGAQAKVPKLFHSPVRSRPPALLIQPATVGFTRPASQQAVRHMRPFDKNGGRPPPICKQHSIADQDSRTLLLIGG